MCSQGAFGLIPLLHLYIDSRDDITRTEAMQVYKLTERHLDHLPCKTRDHKLSHVVLEHTQRQHSVLMHLYPRALVLWLARCKDQEPQMRRTVGRLVTTCQSLGLRSDGSKRQLTERLRAHALINLV